MGTDKDQYREISNHEASIPIFSKGWYLDALVGADNWDLVTVKRNEKIVAALPYWKRKKAGFTMIDVPPLVKFMGPWISYPEGQKPSTKIAWEKEILFELVELLPSVSKYKQQFYYTFTNWLPFFWKDYKQTTKYSYIIQDTSDLEVVFANFAENIRRAIRKAEKQVEVEDTTEIQRMAVLNDKTFKRQGKSAPYSFDVVEQMHAIVQSHSKGKLYIAKDEQGNDHAAAYFIWDENSVYYILGGADEQFRSSGAVSLLLWKGIQLANELQLNFDFEGSMIPEIERFFRAFGGDLVQYMEISKTNSKVLASIGR